MKGLAGVCVIGLAMALPASGQAAKRTKPHKVVLSMASPVAQFPGQNPNYIRVAVTGTLGAGRLRVLDATKQRNGGFSVFNFKHGRIKVRIYDAGVSRVRIKAVSGNGRYRHATGTLRGTTPPLTGAVQVSGTLRY
jgi:hypothetical protein